MPARRAARLPARQPPGQAGHLRYRRLHVPLDVGADGPELGAGPLEEDADLAVVSGEDQDDPPGQEVALDLLPGRHVTPVGVVGTGQRRAGAVRGRRHGAGYQRAPPVRPHDQARPFGERRAAAGVAADADDLRSSVSTR